MVSCNRSRNKLNPRPITEDVYSTRILLKNHRRRDRRIKRVGNFLLRHTLGIEPLKPRVLARLSRIDVSYTTL